MLSGNCTEALSIKANVTISCSSAKLIKNGIAPLPFPLPALLQQYWYIKRGERVRVRGHAPFYATLGFIIGLPCAANASIRRQTVLDTTTTTNISNGRRHVNAPYYANRCAITTTLLSWPGWSASGANARPRSGGTRRIRRKLAETCQ